MGSNSRKGALPVPGGNPGRAQALAATLNRNATQGSLWAGGANADMLPNRYRVAMGMAPVQRPIQPGYAGQMPTNAAAQQAMPQQLPQPGMPQPGMNYRQQQAMVNAPVMQMPPQAQFAQKAPPSMPAPPPQSQLQQAHAQFQASGAPNPAHWSQGVARPTGDQQAQAQAMAAALGAVRRG